MLRISSSPFHAALHLVLWPILFAALLAMPGCGGGGSSSTQTPPPPTPDFALSVEFPTLTMQQSGVTQGQGIYATAENGFTGTIQLTVSGLPANTTLSPAAPYSVTISGTQGSMSFTLGAVTSTPVGTSTVTVKATSGSITHTGTFQLVVTAAPTWAIQASPSSIGITPGAQKTLQVTATTTANTAPMLSLNLPDTTGFNLDGLTISEAQGALTPTNPINVTLQAAPDAVAETSAPLVLTASDGAGNTAILTIPVTVTIPFAANTTPTRSTFARTDQPPGGMVYDQARKLVFATVPLLNEVVVISSIDGHQVAAIPVQAASAIDESMDGTAVYVVSNTISGVTIIDPVQLRVIGHQDVPLSITGGTRPVYFTGVATLSTGEVMLAGQTALLWNPTANTFSPFTNSTWAPLITILGRSANHNKVLLGGVGNSLYDAPSGTMVTNLQFNFDYFAISPDGSRILVPMSGTDASMVYDDTLAPVASVNLNVVNVFGALYSLDSKYIYVSTDSLSNAGGPSVAVLDANSYSVVGLVPSPLPASPVSITFGAVDETQMIFCAAPFAVGFVDASSPTSLSYPGLFLLGVTPATASSSTATSATVAGSSLSSEFTYAAYFGAPPASAASLKSPSVTVQSNTSLAVTIPAGGSAGPANMTVSRSDGSYIVEPEAVSYGPTVLRVDANAASPAGGSTFCIFGYGIVSENAVVTIGGRTATAATTCNSVDFRPFYDPRPVEILALTSPAGSPGVDNITVTTSTGTTTVTNGFQFLQSAQVYPKTGALDAIVYDTSRNRLYVSNSDHNEVEVFDLATSSFLSPIATGKGPTSLAMTPDARLLAVINVTDTTVSVVDLTSNTVRSTYSGLSSQDPTLGCTGPLNQIVGAVGHQAMLSLSCGSTLNGAEVHLMNLDTGSLNCTGVAGCNADGLDFVVGNVTLASTTDGTKVFMAGNPGNGGGLAPPVYLLDFTANTFVTGPYGNYVDAAAAGDGSTYAGSFELFDPTLRQSGIIATERFLDGGAKSTHSLFGEKLNDSGSLLYMPQVSGVDIFDVPTGRIALHVAVPDPLFESWGSLAVDVTGSRMFLISSTGVTVAQLSQVPLSLAHATPSSASAGATVTLRGSGFVSGSTVTVGTTQAAVTYVDGNTLQVTVPSVASGPYRITINNPSGQQYSLDYALTVE